MSDTKTVDVERGYFDIAPDQEVMFRISADRRSVTLERTRYGEPRDGLTSLVISSETPLQIVWQQT